MKKEWYKHTFTIFEIDNEEWDMGDDDRWLLISQRQPDIVSWCKNDIDERVLQK